MRPNRILYTIGFAFALFGQLIPYSNASPFAVEINSKPITEFKSGNDQKVFGRLEFVGGIEFTSPNAHVGALSGMTLIEGRSRILAVTDTGYWFTAKIRRGANGAPLALYTAKMAPLLGLAGKPFRHKWNADAESIAIENDTVFISFERDNRVLRYKLNLDNFKSLPKRLKLNLDVTQLRANKGLETIAISPLTSALGGATIVITERSFAGKNRIKAAILNGPEKGLFTVKRKGRFDITDGGFAPNGDLILLERRFNLANGIGMRIRRIKANDIKAGANLDGEILLLANGSHQIDNMEGLSITTDNQGHVYFAIVSDDNHSLLQRNLYLEFRLIN